MYSASFRDVQWGKNGPLHLNRPHTTTKKGMTKRPSPFSCCNRTGRDSNPGVPESACTFGEKEAQRSERCHQNSILATGDEQAQLAPTQSLKVHQRNEKQPIGCPSFRCGVVDLDEEGSFTLLYSLKRFIYIPNRCDNHFITFH